MYSRFRLAQKYIAWYLRASNGKGHGTHSPFVYSFIREVLNDHVQYPVYDRIEGLRKTLLTDKTTIEVVDLGAGSSSGRARDRRRISDIAKHAAKSPKLAQLLFRIARYYQPTRILELGTSLGISAAYLLSGAGDAKKQSAGAEDGKNLSAGAGKANLTTIEGSPEIAEKARANLATLGIANADVLTGSFDAHLGESGGLPDLIWPIDLAFVDGNHRYQPTVHYYDRLIAHSSPATVLIFDDIHWSAEMERAWETIKSDPRSMLTVDLFWLGLVFRREEFRVQQHFSIRW